MMMTSLETLKTSFALDIIDSASLLAVAASKANLLPACCYAATFIWRLYLKENDRSSSGVARVIGRIFVLCRIPARLESEV